jgi:hypothetical protein
MRNVQTGLLSDEITPFRIKVNDSGPHRADEEVQIGDRYASFPSSPSIIGARKTLVKDTKGET